MKVIKIEKQEAKQFNFGDKVLVLKDGAWIPKGATGIVQCIDEEGDVIVFTEDDDEYFSPQDLELIESGSKEDVAGKYEEGQKFRVITAGGFAVGDIVTLTHDDETDCPMFTRDSDGKKQWTYYEHLVPLATEVQETTVTLELTLEELRLIEATSAITSYNQVKRFFEDAGFPEVSPAKKHEFYTEIKEIRKEAE